MIKTYQIKINIDDKGNQLPDWKVGEKDKTNKERLIAKIEQRLREIFPLSQGDINAYLSSFEEK